VPSWGRFEIQLVNSGAEEVVTTFRQFWGDPGAWVAQSVESVGTSALWACRGASQASLLDGHHKKGLTTRSAAVSYMHLGAKVELSTE
jgi:hypothetical protein